jgi:hypothetical protein
VWPGSKIDQATALKAAFGSDPPTRSRTTSLPAELAAVMSVSVGR